MPKQAQNDKPRPLRKIDIVGVETRGRKKNPRNILPNGLFEDQWEKIMQAARVENVDGAVVLRRIVDWYHDAKEKQDGRYSQKVEFEKLDK